MSQVRPDVVERAGALAALQRNEPGRFAQLARRFRRHPSALIGATLLAIIVVLTVLAPVVARSDPLAINPVEARDGPSLTHLMGTDNLGRDILTRVLYGGRVSLLLGVIAVAIGGVIGTAMGVIAGYFPGFADSVIMVVNDILLTFPGFLLALGAVAVLGTGINNVMIAVGISLIPSFARVVRGSTLTAREADYIHAARVVGAGSSRIIVLHILPNVVAPVIVLSTVGVATAILTGASLSFVGVGAQPPSPEWGLMVNEGRQFLRVAWWISTFPGLAIMLAVIAINLVGDALRDVLDPRLRQ